MQNLCRGPHSSVTVRRFRKQKSYCHVIAIPSAGIAAPTLTVMQGFEAKKDSFVHLFPSSCILYHTEALPPDFCFCPSDLFLAPHGIFLGGKSCCFWPEKQFEFGISARKSLRISGKTFFFFFWRSPDFH